MPSIEEFKRLMSGVVPAEILCTGAKQWPGTFHADHTQHVPHANWIGTDIEAGDGVEIVADLQCIDKHLQRRFDAVFCPATLEHVERPWCAMRAMSQILKPGGVLFVQTHHTFPIHGYPNDYYRFTDAALKSLCSDADLTVIVCEYEYPCTIHAPPEIIGWNSNAESYLNVSVCAVKLS